jgi:hypothetical protein
MPLMGVYFLSLVYLLTVYFYRPQLKSASYREEVYKRGYRTYASCDRFVEGVKRVYMAWRERFVSCCTSVMSDEMKTLDLWLDRESSVVVEYLDVVEQELLDNEIEEVNRALCVMPKGKTSFSLPFGGGVEDSFTLNSLGKIGGDIALVESVKDDCKKCAYEAPSSSLMKAESRLMLQSCVYEGTKKMARSYVLKSSFKECGLTPWGEGKTAKKLISSLQEVEVPDFLFLGQMVNFSIRTRLPSYFWMRRALFRSTSFLGSEWHLWCKAAGGHPLAVYPSSYPGPWSNQLFNQLVAFSYCRERYNAFARCRERLQVAFVRNILRGRRLPHLFERQLVAEVVSIVAKVPVAKLTSKGQGLVLRAISAAKLEPVDIRPRLLAELVVLEGRELPPRMVGSYLSCRAAEFAE